MKRAVSLGIVVGAVLLTAACATPTGRGPVSYDVSDSDRPSATACIDTALAHAGWLEEDANVSVSVSSLEPEGTFRGELRRENPSEAYQWECEVTIDAGFTSLKAQILDFEPADH